MISTIPIIAAGEENNQWCDWKGSFKASNRWSSSLASKVPDMVDLIFITNCMSCSVSLWSKSCAKVIVQSSQVVLISKSSESSTVMTWSIVWIWQPGCTLIVWPNAIVTGEVLLVLGQIWLVAIVPTEYTSHVLLPRLKIFSRVSEMRNLQLALMSVAVPRKSDLRQSWTRFVLRTELPSQKKVCPRWRHPAKLEEERVLKVSVSPIAMRSVRPTSGMMEMLAEKLKWIGRETNSFNGRSCSASTNGTCKIKIMVCSSGRWMKESSSLYKSAGSCTNFWKWFLLAMSSIW